ncbi:MAG TPA: LruC domain-containing protein [Bacteroidales bacterium]|nr:LruC domain-containing protein [Bacteroidales bacterium]
MKTNQILFTVTLFAFLFSASATIRAQVIQDFESGSRNTEAAKCWFFSSTNINGGSNAIADKFSMRTGQMSSMTNQHTLISPWVYYTGSGNLVFKHKIDVLNGAGKFLDVYLIDENNNQTLIYTHTYVNTSLFNESLPITVNGFFKVRWSWYGSGGTSRGHLDDISIPGIYAADPSNNNGGNCAMLSGIGGGGGGGITDTDGDGVPDDEDDYPNDPTRAYNIYFPANGFGTLAFEDLWPAKGDYDFNDLVVDYRFKSVTNAQNEVVEIFNTLVVRAIGASLENGFGYQFPNANLDQSKINVSGYALTENFISLGANGLENGQEKPTIIAFDNAFSRLPHPGSGLGVNTTPGAPYVQPDTLQLTINFSAPRPLYTSLDVPNFNPFLIVNKERGKEVHLPDYLPTSLANTSYFGVWDDDSQPSVNRFYKTSSNLPWAINIYERFDYPIEKVDIVNAHLKFAEWATSGGVLFPDWFKNLSGYRDNANIYTVPSK